MQNLMRGYRVGRHLLKDQWDETAHHPVYSTPKPKLNPVITSSHFTYENINIVRLNDEGVSSAAQYIHRKLLSQQYSPRSWRENPLHFCPPEPYDRQDPLTGDFLNWIFLISSLNFSFWSEKPLESDRYGVQWREGWEMPGTKIWTGYWSLLAAINRALEEGIPITDPKFYSSEILCPDSVIEHVFCPASETRENMPLLRERVAIMRENGSILSEKYGGSFQTFIDEMQRECGGEGTSLDLVKKVADVFPSFRDEFLFQGRKVFFWKRAQILVAEAWAALFPPSPITVHPLFPGRKGAAIHQITMFADYRVPQILHHLGILSYPGSLIRLLNEGKILKSGSREELSIRAASIIAVERLRAGIVRLRSEETIEEHEGEEVSSVLIDFYLWDLAKRLETGEETLEGAETVHVIPAHRTRSIWY